MSKRNGRNFTLDVPDKKEKTTTAPLKLTWYQIMFISLGICFIALGALFTTGDYFWGSGTDIHTYQFPHRDFIAHWLKEGIWPLWNPYIFSGVPFQTGVHPLSYPLALLGLIFSTGWEIKFSILIHLTIAMSFTVYFLRLFNIKTIPAFLGGVSFALGGFFISHLYAGHIDIITSAAYLPVMMYFFEKSLRSSSLKWTVVAGLVMALTLFTGHYQIIYMTILLMGYLTMLRTLMGSNLVVTPLKLKPEGKDQCTWREPAAVVDDKGTKEAIALQASDVPWPTRLKEALYGLERLVLIGIISGCLTLFQLLPMLEATGMANRSVVKDLTFATSFGTPKMNLLTFIAPDFFGGTESVPFFATWSGWEGQGYFGIIAILLLIITVAILPLNKFLPLLIIAFFALLLSIGNDTPVFKWYFAIDPLLGRFRVPSRFVMLVAFIGSWLAAIGLHSISTMPTMMLSKAKKSFLITFGSILAIALFFVYFLSHNTDTQAGQQFIAQVISPRLLRQLPTQAPAFLKFMSAQLGYATLLIIIAGGILDLAFRFPEKRRYLALALVIISGVDLFLYAAPKLTTAPASKFGFNHKVVNYLHGKNTTQQRIMTSPGLRGVNNGEAHGLAHDGGYDTLIDARYNEFANLAMGYDKDRQLMLMTLFNYGPFWQTQGVAWFLSDIPLEKMAERQRRVFSPHFKLDAKIDNYYIYYNGDVLPRAFASHQVKDFPNAESLYRTLTKERLTPNLVYWTNEDGLTKPTELAKLAPYSGPVEKVTISSLTPNKVIIEAEMNQPGLIVMTDTPFPGWRAKVDGQTSQLYSLNGGLHRGVISPAGKHQIEFSYWPQKLTIGLIVSISSFLLSIGFLIWCRRRKIASQLPKAN